MSVDEAIRYLQRQAQGRAHLVGGVLVDHRGLRAVEQAALLGGVIGAIGSATIGRRAAA